MKIQIYSDGSYNKDELFKYTEQFPESFKCLDGTTGQITHGGFIVIGENDEPVSRPCHVWVGRKELTQSWNIGGEAAAVMSAIASVRDWVINYKKVHPEEYVTVEFIYDYEGIGQWLRPLKGVKWKQKTPVAKNYVTVMNSFMSQMPCDFKFTWVPGHNGIKWNEVADALAGRKQSPYIAGDVMEVYI